MSLTLTDIRFRYPRTKPLALDGVSCAFTSGLVTTIVGPNAAGKTTLLRIAAGVASPLFGRVALDDHPLRSIKPIERAKRIAYMAQRPALAAGFTVRQTLALGRYALGADAGALDRALERCSIEDLADRGFQTLSAGQQQRVMLGRAMAQLDPWGEPAGEPASRWLIADEPTSAMDPRHSIETLSLFGDLAARGIGVVTALHDLTSAARVSDRVVAMGAGGRLAARGRVADTMTPDILESIYGVPFVVMESPAGPVVTPVAPSRDE